MMALLKLCLDYVKANPLLGIIAASLVLLILVFLIVIICVSAKRKKARKRLNTEKAQPAQTAQAVTTQTSTAQQANQAAQPAKTVETAKDTQPQPQTSPVDAKEAEKARREAAWKEVEAKLEAQRIAAEKEEAEKLAAEKATMQEAATQETATQETEKTVSPKKENAPAKKAATTKKPAAKAAEKKTEAKTEKAVKTEEKPKAEPKAKAESKSKTEPKAKAPAKPAKENTEENGGKYTGKWVIYRVRTEGEEAEETYYFELRASNGEKLLSSEEYASYSGVLKGIETHKTNIQKGNFRITLSKKGHYIFKILSGKNTLLCTGENYTSLARCESAMESTKRFAKSALLDETVHEQIVKVPVEDDTDVEVILDNGNGKWIISERKVVEGEPLYYFELFANNGEKLLTSEDYTTYIGAVNGISTHKTNIEKGNFRIALTKKGDYIFKLLNGNGQLLSLGEHYKSKRLCQNAVDSVKRFAKNSPVLTDPALTQSL